MPATLRLLTPAILIALLSGCATQQRVGSGPELVRYPHDAIIDAAQQEMANLAIPAARQVDVLEKLEQMMASADVRGIIANRGVTGVVAFKIGGGGVLVGGASGNGSAGFSGGATGRPVQISGWSFGAQVGGGESVGVMLCLGMNHDEWLDDVYEMQAVGGSFATTGYISAVGRPGSRPHELRIIGTGTGAGGGATIGQLTIVQR